MESLPDYGKIQFPMMKMIPFNKVFPNASPDELDLLGQFLVYNNSKRISAKQVIYIYKYNNNNNKEEITYKLIYCFIFIEIKIFLCIIYYNNKSKGITSSILL